MGLVLFWLSGCRAPAAAPRLDDFAARLDQVVPRRLESYGVPGAAVAVAMNGEVAWAKGYGLADRERGEPVKTDTVFQAASISKTLTAWGVMRLVEQGRVELDAPVERYLRRWRLPDAPSNGDGSNAATGVTIRRLLSHSAGLNITEYLGYTPDTSLPAVEEVLSQGSGKTGPVCQVRPAGGRFAYTDGGYVILQLVVEEVSGRPFAEFMQDEVLQPLGMKDSSFSLTPELEAKLATPYGPNGEALPRYRFVELAPAGLLTTAPDLARFAAAALPGGDGGGVLPAGRGVIAPQTLGEMIIPQVYLSGFDTVIYADAYGMGYFIETLPGGQVAISHMGGNLGWLSEMAILPATGDALVVMTNSSVGHEFFADVAAEWTDWLGLPGTLRVAGTIRTAGLVLRVGATIIGAASLGWLLVLFRQLRAGRRRLGWRTPRWRGILAPGALAVALLLYFWLAQPFVQTSLPGEAGWLAFSATLLCTTGIFWGFTSVQETTYWPRKNQIISTSPGEQS